MVIWPECQHPRTPENTCHRVAKQPGGQCRTCLNVVKARYKRTRKGRAAQARYRRGKRGRATNARYERSKKGLRVKAQVNWRRLGIIDLTWERFEVTVAQQRGACAICGEPPRRERLHADHDHTTGKFRAALCRRCNASLENYERGVRVSPELANKFVEYLKEIGT